MSLPKTSVLDLPDEILLAIVDRLVVQPRYDRSAHGDLTALAISHPRFTCIIREALQKSEVPCVPLPKVHALFRTLLDFPRWANSIKSLEITNYASSEASVCDYGIGDIGTITFKDNKWERKMRKKLGSGTLSYDFIKRTSGVPSRQFDITFDDTFRKQCLDVVRGTVLSNRMKQTWEAALQVGHTSAFLALLISILPNLEELFLGAGHILHYPMVSQDANDGTGAIWCPYRDYWISDDSRQLLEDHKYLGRVFQKLHPQLKTLEMPSSWTGLDFERARKIIPRFRHFKNLSTLILPDSAFPWILIPYLTFPQSLSTFVITDCPDEASDRVLSFVLYIDFARADGRASFLNLHTIEMYFTSVSPDILEFETKNVADPLGIEVVHHYHAGELMAADVGGQPWKLDEAELNEVAETPREERFIRPLAGHWVGKPNKKGPSASSAKEHFRGRRKRQH